MRSPAAAGGPAVAELSEFLMGESNVAIVFMVIFFIRVNSEDSILHLPAAGFGDC